MKTDFERAAAFGYFGHNIFRHDFCVQTILVYMGHGRPQQLALIAEILGNRSRAVSIDCYAMELRHELKMQRFISTRLLV